MSRVRAGGAWQVVDAVDVPLVADASAGADEVEGEGDSTASKLLSPPVLSCAAPHGRIGAVPE
jgi:hypothetical protein